MHLALIEFLNARPLWWGLVHGEAGRDTHEFTSPARCADMIAGGGADLGLIPAVELARIPDVVAVPGLCIASRSEVRSVLLFSRVPFDEIRSVALDPSSRTSVALARILLAERLGEERYRSLRFDPIESSRADALDGHDAAVIIGDPALQLTREGLVHAFRYDLASEWTAMFDEPFVFAVWAGRGDLVSRESDIVSRLERSLDYGLARLDTIARAASAELGLPVDELLDYFHHALHYRMGEGERAALSRFHILAARWGLVPEAKEIEWLPAPTSTQS